MALTAAEIKHLTGPGRHADGQGLYLNISKGGTRSWVHRVVVDGRRRDIGLGGFPAVGLAEARRKAEANRRVIGAGGDPVQDKRQSRAIPTFREATTKCHANLLPTWRNPDHGRYWLASLELHALPAIGAMRVDTVTTADVLDVLSPIWTAKPVTASRVRQRCRQVFKWAQARGYIGVNPAGEAIDGGLPRQRHKPDHHKTLGYDQIASLYADVRDAEAISKGARLCLQWVVLTACRSGEARGATWDEISDDGTMWTIPGSRMKAGVEHRVPLSDEARQVLKQAQALDDGSGYLFPSIVRLGRPLSDDALPSVLRRTGWADKTTTHGLRAAFRTWALECTSVPWAVAEMALAHRVGNSVAQAYVRGDLFERRAALMQDWSEYVTRTA